jgi:hypothetical protein
MPVILEDGRDNRALVTISLRTCELLQTAEPAIGCQDGREVFLRGHGGVLRGGVGTSSTDNTNADSLDFGTKEFHIVAVIVEFIPFGEGHFAGPLDDWEDDDRFIKHNFLAGRLDEVFIFV